MVSIQARHIQDQANAAGLEAHWGYADRVVPCVNDAGSCEYLDVVYGAHDVGMVYTGVLWLTMAAVLLVWGALRLWAAADKTANGGGLRRAGRAVAATCRHYLLPESLQVVFGRTTRYQVTILALLTAYLAIWSFVGFAYRTWVTPVKGIEGVYNIRTSLGPFSDRVGVLAYALTPLSVLLSSRESVLSVVTGLPYQSFNFLHRWVGYLILLQSAVHTIGWSIVEVRLYQPQPKVAREWVEQEYIIWGVVAMTLVLLICILSIPAVIDRTGYEFFRKSHYVLAAMYVGACIAHWEKLHCFLTPSLLLWGIDRFVRALRTLVMHRKAFGGGRLFSPATASVTLFAGAQDGDGDIVRLDIKHPPHRPWKVGEHFYLCFNEVSFWQSHPFTPINYPETVEGVTSHSYVFRAKAGETRKMAQLAAKKGVLEKEGGVGVATTSVILTGPYGGDDIIKGIAPTDNILCVAGGTGIAYVLPVLLGLSREIHSDRRVDLVWIVRRRKDIGWVRHELGLLQETGGRVSVRVCVTRERDSADGDGGTLAEQDLPPAKGMVPKAASSFSVVVGVDNDGTRHPDVGHVVETFVGETARGRTMVYGSGPGAMMTDLRRAVARCNSGGKIWQGQERFGVHLRCDDRMER